MNAKTKKNLFDLLELRTGRKNELSRKIIKSYRETYDAAFNTLDDGRITSRTKNKIYALITRLLFEDLAKVKKIDRQYRKKERRQARALRRALKAAEKARKREAARFYTKEKNTPKKPKGGDKIDYNNIRTDT